MINTLEVDVMEHCHSQSWFHWGIGDGEERHKPFLFLPG